MTDTVISVEGLGKRYRLAHQTGPRDQYRTLRQDLSAAMRRIAGLGGDGGAGSTEDFWALRNVTFEVKQGEVIGVIGRNGAGKSTLLKILSRITEPTEGRARIRGRVASLLEVGTGFHPELTGRENIFLNGVILGMSRLEVRQRFDEIVAFAEVERFLDTPVRHYSTGMYVRLAFAVAAHLEPQILVVDEVLSVGDAAFQKRCIGKMNEISSKQGRTILFVSHNLGAVRDLCQRAILLDRGAVADDSSCDAVVRNYLASSPGDFLTRRGQGRQEPGALASIMNIAVRNGDGDQVDRLFLGDDMFVELDVQFHRETANPEFGLLIHTAEGVPMLDVRTRHSGIELQRALGRYRVSAVLRRVGLYPGDYYLSAWVNNHSIENIDWIQYGLPFSILPVTGAAGDMRLSFEWGKYFVPSEWTTESLQGNREAAPDPSRGGASAT